MLKGIDVSEHQGAIDWNRVKGQIDYAILRVGYGDDIPNQDDAQWSRNVSECERLGIPYGVYIYSYATTEQQIRSEAAHTLRLLKGHKPLYPIYLDLEDEGTTGTLSNKTIATFAEIFCNIIESAGYYAGIYANTYWFNTRLTNDIFSKYDKWVAEYNNKCNYGGGHGMWQFTDSGTFNGIAGPVDTNYSYLDYPAIIKSAGLNGHSPGSNQAQSSRRNCVIYEGEVDKAIAQVLSWGLNDCIVVSKNEYKKGMGRSVYIIGRACNSNIKADVRIQGHDRKETLKLVEKRIGLR